MELGPLQKEWVETLKKKSHRQVVGTLGKRYKNGHVQACCLGQFLLCKMKKERQPLPSGEAIMDGGNFDSILGNSFEELGLKDSEGTFYDMIKFKGSSYDSLAAMNDRGLTWPDIAEFVENYPEKVFTRSV